MNTISIVMVTYHTGDVCLNLAIDAALGEPECHELILVNNGNPPGLEQALTARAAQDKRLRFISGHGNVGFAKACNLGAKVATGDYILLLNPDCMLRRGALARALEGIRPYTENTMAGCYLLNPSGTEQRGGRRGLMTPMNAFFESFGLSSMLPKEQRLNMHNTPMPPDTHDVPAISGAFMLLARGYYQKLKGMDESYFLHMEDMDLCKRVHKNGGRIICNPAVKVIHFRSTSEVSSAFVEREKAKSFVYYLKVHSWDPANAFFARMMIPAIWLRYYAKRSIGWLAHLFEPPLYERQKTARLAVLHRALRFTKPNPELKDKIALVTGASGQLGLALVGELLASGAKVIAVTKRTRLAFKHENLAWVERDFDKDANPLNGAQVDIMIHAAGIKYLPKLLPVVCDGGVSKVVAFSCLTLSDKASSPHKQDQKRFKHQSTAEKEITKIAAAKNVALTVFQTTDMYGTGLDRSLARQANVIKRFGKLPIEFPASGLRQPAHVQDIAQAVMSALVTPTAAGKTYSLAGADTLTYRDLLERVFMYMGRKPNFIRIPAMKSILNVLGKLYGVEGMNADMATQMNRSITADNTQAVQELGYKPRPFLQGDTGL